MEGGAKESPPNSVKVSLVHPFLPLTTTTTINTHTLSHLSPTLPLSHSSLLTKFNAIWSHRFLKRASFFACLFL